MAQAKFIVTYIDSHETKQTRTTDTYSGARKIADYIQDKGGKARVSVIFDRKDPE